MTRVETFRQSFHEKYKSTNSGGVLHIIGVLCVGIGGIIGPWFFIENLHLQDLLIIPATFLYANLVEYLMHRFPMHRKIKPIGIIFERHTLEHHYFFTDTERTMKHFRDVKALLFPFSLIFIFIGCIAFPSSLLIGHFFSHNLGYLFFSSAVAYYINYEVFHFLYHYFEPSKISNLWIVRKMRKHHTFHHNKRLMSHKNFNVTYPICDWIFGTLYWGESAAPQKEETRLSMPTH